MKLCIRFVVYCIGLLFLAFGVAFSVNSNLGVSPVNSLPYVISLITKVDMGTCVVVVFSAYIVIQIAIKRRKFKWINLTQLIFSTIFGYFVDFAKTMLGTFVFPTYLGQLGMLAISIVLVAVGVAIYMDAGLVNMPMEGMTMAISESLPKKEFHQVKVLVDCTSVGFGILLSFVFLHGLFGIREGTILCALCVGKLLSPIKKMIQPMMKRLL